MQKNYLKREQLNMNDTTTIENRTDEQLQPKVDNVPQKKKRMAKKRERIPLHKQKRIGIDQEKGYHYHLTNDDGNRVARFKKAGYVVVDGKVREGQKDSQDASQLGKVARQSVGNGMEAVYMRIPQKDYDQDQASKQKAIDDRDKVIGLDKIPEYVRRGKVKIDYGPPDEG